MTPGQQRAIRELRQLTLADENIIDVVSQSISTSGLLTVTVGINIGFIECSEDGLDLREYEEFIIIVPKEFPFERPYVLVAHTRFAGFPHVTWRHGVCLYQSSVEWNPADGLYGLFARLIRWLGKAAINQMDPIDGPLEPPHHVTDFSQNPFVIRADAPCVPGESWVGLAILEKHSNRTDLVGWYDFKGEFPAKRDLAFAVILPKALPMEFPSKGQELFQELEKAGMKKDDIVHNLAVAALFATDDGPIHFVVGLPMRRAADGSPRLHIAVWTVAADEAKFLKNALEENADTQEIKDIRMEIRQTVLSIFENLKIAWCRVFEERSEIVVRRDGGTPLAWCTGKRILILGCGALGSWAGEILARARPTVLHLVDNSSVKPGILVRQNFELLDIGLKKANALAERLKAIDSDCDIVAYTDAAHPFIVANAPLLKKYDLILDCTASLHFQMQLESTWPSLQKDTPPIISLIIDSLARHCLAVVVQEQSVGGVWGAYVCLKEYLCMRSKLTEIVDSFYDIRSMDNMFQPEPGCSDPTFVGSAADIMCLLSGALNGSLRHLGSNSGNAGLVFSPYGGAYTPSISSTFELSNSYECRVGNYRVCIAKLALEQAKDQVKKNNRARSARNETGGIVWGFWDNTTNVIWIFEVSGPPPDSRHSSALFVCGVKGTKEEHDQRALRSHGVSGFIGHWHTHPELPSKQSTTDRESMIGLVSSLGLNQKRSLMMIFGRSAGQPTLGVYVYESTSTRTGVDLVSIGETQLQLDVRIV